MEPQVYQYHPVTPPNSSRYSTSRDISPTLSNNQPISPPTSTHSDDSWMYSTSTAAVMNQQSNSMATQTTHLVDPDHIINDLFFPMDLDPTKPAEYNLDMVNRLDQIQGFMDAGIVNQSNFNLNISNAQQLEDMNDWLARLSDSIVTGQLPQPVMDTATSFAYNQMSNFTPPSQPEYDQNTAYPSVPSQPMYTSCEENEMYVRSQPMVASQSHYSYQPVVLSQQNMGLVGQRQHYTSVPDVSNQYFQPELKSTINFTKANHPESREIEKEEIVSFKPTLVTHDEKKHLATLVNSFSSALDLSKQQFKKKEEAVTFVKKNDEFIRDLITSDLSKLSLNDDDDDRTLSADTPVPKEKDSLYPNVNHKHILLLKKMTDWVNQNYHESHASLLSQ